MTRWTLVLIVWATIVVAGLAWLAWAMSHARSDLEIWGRDSEAEEGSDP